MKRCTELCSNLSVIVTVFAALFCFCHKLTAWGGVLFEKLIVIQRVKDLLGMCGTWNLIAVFAAACCLVCITSRLNAVHFNIVFQLGSRFLEESFPFTESWAVYGVSPPI